MSRLALALSLAFSSAPATGQVKLGVDVLLEDRIELVEGLRVGLVTHPAGVDSALVPTIDRLAADERVRLVQLFGPEHGVRGDVAAGEDVFDARDPRTGVPVESLYGARRRPSKESLERIDVLLFDLQDVGARMYTYISTLGEAMTAAGEAGVKVVVLDRPNPLGGLRFEGPVMPEEWESFISWGPLPMTHGMTMGEIARLWKERQGVSCELDVVRMSGWERSMVWEDTGLEWLQSSPHIPHPVSAHLYLATGAIGESFEGIHCGVGYTTPFEVLAAPGLDENALADVMNERGLSGVHFLPFITRPFYGEQEGVEVRGVKLILTDERSFRPVRTALALLIELHGQLGEELRLKSERAFAIRWGGAELFERVTAGATLAELEASFVDGLKEFEEVRAELLLY
ncbi:MAG: DUF1343 domain-containing protein [Planctomycetes bacterium]|nr:DUF1343 domain-containing protein [Planctomycetota bacterium]